MGGRLIYLMGPSGSGKDSLIEAARASLQQYKCVVARRVITRSAESLGEDAMGVSPDEFARLKAEGSFALCWTANGLEYGIPVVIDRWLGEGRDVLVNGSRGHLGEARRRYRGLLPVLLTVEGAVLRERLLRRGRESLAEIETRLSRNGLFSQDSSIAGVPVHMLDNSGDLAVTVANLLEVLKLSAGPDQT